MKQYKRVISICRYRHTRDLCGKEYHWFMTNNPPTVAQMASPTKMELLMQPLEGMGLESAKTPRERQGAMIVTD